MYKRNKKEKLHYYLDIDKGFGKTQQPFMVIIFSRQEISGTSQCAKDTDKKLQLKILHNGKKLSAFPQRSETRH